MNYSYSDNYLKSDDAINERALVDQKVNEMGESPKKVEELLDKWLNNFSTPAEKKLALKVFCNIEYFNRDKYKKTLDQYKTKISQYLIAKEYEWKDVLLIIPHENADSAHFHSYELCKSWGLQQRAVIPISEVNKIDDVCSKYFVFFNDTHGSGNQFISEFSEFIRDVGPNNCLVVSLTNTKKSLNLFHEKLDGITIIPEVSTPTLFEKSIFTPEELELLENLGEKVYKKHPMGFSRCGLLVAYYFQCPNNNLPIVWANGTNNCIGNQKAYPWAPLFEYLPKIKSTSKEESSKEESSKEESSKEESSKEESSKEEFNTSKKIADRWKWLVVFISIVSFTLYIMLSIFGNAKEALNNKVSGICDLPYSYVKGRVSFDKEAISYGSSSSLKILLKGESKECMYDVPLNDDFSFFFKTKKCGEGERIVFSLVNSHEYKLGSNSVYSSTCKFSLLRIY